MKKFNELIEKINNDTYQKTILSLENKKIDNKKATILARAIKNNSYVKELDVSSNKITSIGIIALCETNLIKLKINNTFIDDEGAVCLANSKTLLELEAQACDITANGANILFTNNILQKINLSFNSIKQEGFAALPTNDTLRILILRQCAIDDNCAALIAQARGLEIVDLSTNLLKERGAGFFGLNTTIKKLNLSQNHINDLGASFFAINASLQKLDLFNCSLTSVAAKFLSQNKTLTELDLSFNRLDDECAQHLVMMSTLKILSLAHNKITAEGQKILMQSSSIEVLGLGYNLIAKHTQGKNEIQPEDKVIPCSDELKNIIPLPADMTIIVKKDKISQSTGSSTRTNNDIDQSLQSEVVNKQPATTVFCTRIDVGQKKSNGSNKRKLNNSKYPKTQKKQRTKPTKISITTQQQAMPMMLFKLHTNTRPKLAALDSHKKIKHTQEEVAKKWNASCETNSLAGF